MRITNTIFGTWLAVTCMLPSRQKMDAPRIIAMFLLLFCLGDVRAEPLVGQFKVASTVDDIVGAESSGIFKNVVKTDLPIEWNVYVPHSYDLEKPAGLMVYVSPTNSGQIPTEWKSVMGEQNLIWVSANNYGNKIDGNIRVVHAILAPWLVGRDYNIDTKRFYVSGLSGGGRVASIIAPEYAHIFKGAIYNCGVNFWGRETPKRIEQVRLNRFVFVTGSGDFNRRDTKKAHNSYRKSGIENTLLMDIPNLGHANPGAKQFAEAIDFLDAGSPR